MINELISRVGKTRTLQEQESKPSLSPSGLGKIRIVPTYRLTFTSESFWRRLMFRFLSSFTPYLAYQKATNKNRNGSGSFYLAETLSANTGLSGKETYYPLL